MSPTISLEQLSILNTTSAMVVLKNDNVEN